MLEFIGRHKKQFLVLFLVLAGLNIFAVLLLHANTELFIRFIGNLNPLVLLSIISILSILVLAYFVKLNWFKIYDFGKLRVSVLVVPTVLFASIAIVVDLLYRFPREMNIAFPKSLLFYPVIAFVVEILFHVIPLLLLLKFAALLFKTAKPRNLFGIVILIVAILEPFYQLLNMPQYPIWVMGITGVNLYAFNLFQLWHFKKFGFLSMYSARLLYYLIWHVIWGHYRLDILF